jgi:hypothetical protein
MKLIFGDGDRESEIFLHINASIKKGQFSMKDPRIWRLGAGRTREGALKDVSRPSYY